MVKEVALQNLVDISNTLNGKHWWLEAGTCLGAVREGDFIGHDKDTDVGILAEDFNWALIAELVTKGFRILHVFGAPHRGLEVSVARGGVKTDIFLFYKKGDKRWHGAWTNGCRDIDKDLIKLVFESDLVETLGEAKLCDTFFPVPKNVNKYLEARYGEHWRVPNENWNWATDPFCIDPYFEI